jgi:hypothetical protein
VPKTKQAGNFPDDIGELRGLGAKMDIRPRPVTGLSTGSGARTGTDLEPPHGWSLEDSFY